MVILKLLREVGGLEIEALFHGFLAEGEFVAIWCFAPFGD